MADFGFWTLVGDFEFWTVVSDFGFWTLVADFGFWILDSSGRQTTTLGFYVPYSLREVHGFFKVPC